MSERIKHIDECSADLARAFGRGYIGMDSAVQHCDRVEPSWSDHAYTFLSFYAARQLTPFTIERCRLASAAYGVPAAVEARAWGALAKQAIANGLIERVGFAPTVASHGSVRATYRLRRPQ